MIGNPRWCAYLFVLFLTGCATAPEVAQAVHSELAPSGTLRVGINAGYAVLMRQEPGERRGVPVDLVRELGRRLGVPVELKTYPSRGQTVAAGEKGEWDVAFIAVDRG
jgi:polar amino acid transport system substrate-binding protein